MVKMQDVQTVRTNYNGNKINP